MFTLNICDAQRPDKRFGRTPRKVVLQAKSILTRQFTFPLSKTKRLNSMSCDVPSGHGRSTCPETELVVHMWLLRFPMSLSLPVPHFASYPPPQVKEDKLSHPIQARIFQSPTHPISGTDRSTLRFNLGGVSFFLDQGISWGNRLMPKLVESQLPIETEDFFCFLFPSTYFGPQKSTVLATLIMTNTVAVKIFFCWCLASK